jgi:rhodanese-related sulfurtransferase
VSDRPVATHVHSPGFLALVNEARARVREIEIPAYIAAHGRGDRPVLVDVREEHEWDAGRLPGAMHLGKGIIERDIEQHFPDRDTPLVCYCGGGFRSVLVCENLQRMGYRNARSLAGGYRGWIAAGHPIETDETE